jgi:CheY-like chemotaxis protein
VLEAASGVEARQIWQAQPGRVQLLLTDMVLPGGLGGRDLAAQLRKVNPGLKVIFTTGYSAELAGRELALAEGQAFLQKPNNTHELLEAVRHCLDS